MVNALKTVEYGASNVKWKTKNDAMVNEVEEGFEYGSTFTCFFVFACLFYCLSRVPSQTPQIGFPVVPKLHQLILGMWWKEQGDCSRTEQGDTLVTDWLTGWRQYYRNNLSTV